MDKSISRIISKAFFLLVTIGFFVPLALDKNGFQLADHLSKMDQKFASFSLYFIFVLSFIGIILFILLLLKNKFSILFDWIVIIVTSVAVLAIFSIFGVAEVVNDRNIKYSDLLQSGAFLVFIGLIISTIFNLFSSFTKEENNKITYDIKSFLIVFAVISSIIIGMILAITTG